MMLQISVKFIIFKCTNQIISVEYREIKGENFSYKNNVFYISRYCDFGIVNNITVKSPKMTLTYNGQLYLAVSYSMHNNCLFIFFMMYI